MNDLIIKSRLNFADELDRWVQMSDSEVYYNTRSKMIVRRQFDAMCRYLEDRLKLLIMVRQKACGGVSSMLFFLCIIHSICIVKFLRAVHNRRPQPGGGSLATADILRTKGFFSCECSQFLEQQTSDFSKFMVCPHGQEGGGPFWTKRE